MKASKIHFLDESKPTFVVAAVNDFVVGPAGNLIALELLDVAVADNFANEHECEAAVAEYSVLGLAFEAVDVE